MTEPRWKDQAQRRGIHIDLSTQLEEVPFILGNPSELREVLTNIVFNAIDAMPEGREAHPFCRHIRQGARVEVRVSDTGVGMTEEVRTKRSPTPSSRPRG